MDLASYKTYTRDTYNWSDEDFASVLAVFSDRLARLLCRDSLPDPLPDDLAMLLAYFIYFGMEALSLRGKVKSKALRYYTVTMENTEFSSPWGMLASNFGDIIRKYSQCAGSINVEKNRGCPHCF